MVAEIKGKTAAELASLFSSEFVSPGGDFSYGVNETEDGIIIKQYTGQNSVLVIPQQIEGFPVVQVGGVGNSGFGAFNKENAKISAIIIPKGVKVLGRLSDDKNALRDNLEAIVLPSTLTEINGGPDGWGKLTSLDLSHCVNLTEISDIGEMTSNLQSVKLPDSVKIIRDKTFQWCGKLTDINIPANIEIIAEDAFKFCYELYNLTIPDSITSIRFAHWKEISDYPNYTYEWADTYGGDPIDVFEGDKKLPIAVRKRLQDLGYKGKF